MALDVNEVYQPTQESLEVLWQEAGERVAHRFFRTGFTVHILSSRFTRRLAAERTSYDRAAARRLARAWQLTAVTELCWILPARELARTLISKSQGRMLVLPFPGYEHVYFNEWATSRADLLYLYFYLYRLNVNVCFAPPNKEIAEKQNLKLTLKPSPHWNSNFRIYLYKDQGLHPAAIRGLKRIRSKIRSTLGWVSWLKTYFHFNKKPRVRMTNELPEFQLPLVQNSAGFLSISHVDPSKYRRYLYLSLRKQTHRNYRLMRKFVRHQGLTLAHVCDQPSFDSGIFGASVESLNGALILWPHSTNPCAIDSYDSARLKAIHTLMLRSANSWKQKYSSVQVSINPDLMLPAIGKNIPYNPQKPINLLFIGVGAHMHRYPIVSFQPQRETFAQSIKSLKESGVAYRCFYKPKPGYETPEIFETFAPPDFSYENLDKPLEQINFANTIFLTLSVGSSALIEGCAWGVPVLILKNINMSDHAPVPWQISGSQLGQELQHLSTSQNWAHRVEQQQIWLKREIRPKNQDLIPTAQ